MALGTFLGNVDLALECLVRGSPGIMAQGMGPGGIYIVLRVIIPVPRLEGSV